MNSIKKFLNNYDFNKNDINKYDCAMIGYIAGILLCGTHPLIMLIPFLICFHFSFKK